MLDRRFRSLAPWRQRGWRPRGRGLQFQFIRSKSVV